MDQEEQIMRDREALEVLIEALITISDESTSVLEMRDIATQALKRVQNENQS